MKKRSHGLWWPFWSAAVTLWTLFSTGKLRWNCLLYTSCKCGKGELSRFEQAHILGHRESRFDLEFLVDNAPLVRKAYPELLTEPASIDDIMTFFVKGSDETV